MTTNPQTDARARFVAAIRSAPFEELRAESPNGPLVITARVDDLADAVLAAVSVPASAPTDEVAEVAKHVTRAIFALKTLSPDGSTHYQSGWDDGLEAAMDAARDAVLAVLPAPTDRAAILREAAAAIDATREPFPIAVQNGITWATAELRRAAAASGSGRVADETQAPEHTGGNAEDCPVCRPEIDKTVLYPWICPGPAVASQPDGEA